MSEISLKYVAAKSGLLSPGRKYDLDFDHEFLASETWDAMPTYKHFDGYGPGCAVATDPQTGLDVIVGIENRDGNTPVKFFDERSDQGRLPPGGHAGAYPAEFHRARAEDPLCTYRLRLVHEERRQASS